MKRRSIITAFCPIFFTIAMLLASSLSAQRLGTAPAVGNAPASVMPSFEQMIGSIEDGEATATKVIEDMKQSMLESSVTENTEESVATAITSATESLVSEDVIPETNLTTAEAIDTMTRRYAPRLKIDFHEFPLRQITQMETLLSATERSGIAATVSHAEKTATRIRNRAGTPDIKFRFEGRTVYLSGAAPSERQRLLVETMLRFEPGIDRIENNLIVRETAGR